MIRILLLGLLTFSMSINLHSQLADGSIAPDFTAVDIEGNTHNLYDLLAEGKSVVLDFSTTWCGPCWSYKNTGALHKFMEEHGPEGTNEAMVLFIEPDITTTQADLEGTGPKTFGDWITGVNHPIIDNSALGSIYQVGAFPTILMVCPDRKIKNIGQIPAGSLLTNSQECPALPTVPEISFRASAYAGCGDFEVAFFDNSWPRPDTYLWEFGDGVTSTEREPVHTYNIEGDFNVKLTASRNDESADLQEEAYVKVEEGYPKPRQAVGPANIDIGTGRYFEGGHQGLIIDAQKDILIASATVYSSKAADRTIVVNDTGGNLISSTTVFIEEGEQRIDLNLYVPAGTDFRLGLHNDAYMFRNDSGVRFPYEIDDLMSIKTSTVDNADALNYYYYFYNLDVRESGCQSITSAEEIVEENIRIYPNPSMDYITIESDNTSDLDDIQLTNMMGQTINVEKQSASNSVRMNMARLETGVYLIKVNNTIKKVYKQ